MTVNEIKSAMLKMSQHELSHIIQLANQKKIPILHLQEGLHVDTQEAYEHSKFHTIFLESADKYLAWGKLSKDFQVKIGKIPAEDVIELGSPRFSELNLSNNENNEIVNPAGLDS